MMSHVAGITRSEVYDFRLSSTGSPSARTTVLYSPSGPHLPGCSLSRPPLKRNGLDDWEH